MSPTKNLALVVFACLAVDGAFYADAAPSVSPDELADSERQIEKPLRMRDDDRRGFLADEPLAKGPLSGIIPGGGEQTTAAPATTAASSGPSIPGAGYLSGGGLPTGLPGLSQGDGDGNQSPTLILGGFSVIVVPMRGMNMANMASMLSAGQQLGQMFPKPGGS